MPRIARQIAHSGIYHIMLRGINRQDIFIDDTDRQRFLQLLEQLPQDFNKKYGRTGHFFQDRFKSEPCEDFSYFLTLLRYIHQNGRTKQEQSQACLNFALQGGRRR